MNLQKEVDFWVEMGFNNKEIISLSKVGNIYFWRKNLPATRQGNLFGPDFLQKGATIAIPIQPAGQTQPLLKP